LRIDLAYDGTEFSGWARQPGLRTVAATVEDALRTVFRLDAVETTVAGRTDAGVHAAGQVVHVDIPTSATVAIDNAARRLGGLLPPDIVVHTVTVAPAGFDARFAATGRHYAYRIADRRVDPLRRRDTLAWPRPLDAIAMDDAARGLEGEHDFAAYCRPREGASTVRVLHQLRVQRGSDEVLTVRAHADAFCHHQVRSMVGALLAVGDGRRAVGWPAEVLATAQRCSAVQVAPALGLTLIGVDYPADALLAERVLATRRRRGD
jgi:tRNA pseudouridine38-40 synthase